MVSNEYVIHVDLVAVVGGQIDRRSAGVSVDGELAFECDRATREWCLFVVRIPHPVARRQSVDPIWVFPRFNRRRTVGGCPRIAAEDDRLVGAGQKLRTRRNVVIVSRNG